MKTDLYTAGDIDILVKEYHSNGIQHHEVHMVYQGRVFVLDDFVQPAEQKVGDLISQLQNVYQDIVMKKQLHDRELEKEVQEYYEESGDTE